MKVIDLLNKIANGEEVPEKIKWEDTIYVYSKYDKDYLEFPISVDEYKGLFNMKNSILSQYLNEEVEIIEDIQKEDKKIEKLDLDDLNILLDKDYNDYMIRHIVHKALVVIKSKINEIIDKINGE